MNFRRFPSGTSSAGPPLTLSARTLHIGSVLLCLLWLLLGAHRAPAQESGASEYQVKAAFLYKFTRFVDWPSSAFSSGNSPFVIGVLGRDPFGSTLDRTLEGKSVGEHPIVVRRYKTLDDMQTCHILFISESENDRVAKTVARLGRSPILVVGDMPRFVQRGGAVNFVIEDSKVHFEINPDAADRAGLSISSKMLSLARIVRP